jgi:hypothetical protein
MTWIKSKIGRAKAGLVVLGLLDISFLYNIISNHHRSDSLVLLVVDVVGAMGVVALIKQYQGEEETPTA